MEVHVDRVTRQGKMGDSLIAYLKLLGRMTTCRSTTVNPRSGQGTKGAAEAGYSRIRRSNACNFEMVSIMAIFAGRIWL